VKVLAKLGLVTAAAATVLFIFIYEFQGPVINRVMSQPPTETPNVKPIEKVQEMPAKITSDIELPTPLTEITEEPIKAAELTKQETAVITKQTVSVKQELPAGPTRRIYGKIILSSSGEQLEGVNIMVPESNVAKVSNATGGYTIEVPKNARELVFIYRGKKLVQPISPGNSLVNVTLNLEKMQYD